MLYNINLHKHDALCLMEIKGPENIFSDIPEYFICGSYVSFPKQVRTLHA